MTILQQNNNLEKDERHILQDSFHGLRTLTRKHDQLAQHFWRSVWTTAQAEVAFILALAAFLITNRFLSLLCVVLLVVFLLNRFAPVLLLTDGLLFRKLHKRVYRRPMIYWGWWPCWTFFFCITAAGVGAFVGRFLWKSTLVHYYEVEELQTYKDVNVDTVPGSQIMDAGMVTFAEGVSIDRSHGGCFVNLGHTYCVSPIVTDGKMPAGLAGGPITGSYDYFAVGVDCCSCPNQDFRCGEWRNPMTHGGLRSQDVASRPFYRLAVDDFSAAWGKESKHPLFFEWTHMPIFKWKALWSWTMHCVVLAVCSPIPVVFLLAALVGHLLQNLVHSATASPLDAPKPPAGMEGAWRAVLPEIVHQYEEEQRQLVALPISPMPWYASIDQPPPPPRLPPAPA